VILNLDATPDSHGSEYAGYTAEEHCELFSHYAPEFQADYVLADTSVVSNMSALENQVKAMGGTLVVADLRVAHGSVHHDPEKLASVFGNIMANSLIG
jgi:hypothetical protein